MKAWQISAPDGPASLRLTTVASQACGPGELRVAIEATALNRADLLQCLGRYPIPSSGPAIPGLEFSGRVIEKSPSCERFDLGDRVMGLCDGGAFAEAIVVHEGLVIAVPDGFSPAAAGAFPEAYFTAYDALFRQARWQSGDRILIHAAGSGLGTAALRLAKHFGAEVVVTASTGKHAALKSMGADLVLDSRQPELTASILGFSQGQGIDVILDLIGAPWLASNLKVAAIGARMIVLGLLGGAKTEINLAALMTRRMTIAGSLLRPRSQAEKAALIADFERDAKEALDQLLLRPVIDSVHDFQDLPQAFRTMQDNRNFGKIAVIHR